MEAWPIRRGCARDTSAVHGRVPGGGGADRPGDWPADRPGRSGAGINAGTLGNWVVKDRAGRGDRPALSEDERAELARLRTENTELRMQRDVLKRSVVLWVDEAMGR